MGANEGLTNSNWSPLKSHLHSTYKNDRKISSCL